MAAPNSDELDGPLFRVRLAAETELFDRSTGEWRAHSSAPGAQFTVVKRDDTIDLQTTQQVFAWDDIPLRVLIGKLLRAFLKIVEK